MDRSVVPVASLLALSLMGVAAPTAPTAPASPASSAREAPPPKVPLTAAIAMLGPPPAVEPPPPPPPPTPAEALEDGVLIVVSIPSQQMFVFEDGDLWDTSDVSTGKPGSDTPTGNFPILQKKVQHRSNLYDDAPMPYMQRLTWDGVALHAGRVPGYPASHGCIRLPKSFAEKLYKVTNFTSTLVMVTDEPVTSAKQARKLI